MQHAPFYLYVALAVFAFGLVSGRLHRSIITPPMVFVLLGLLGAEMFRPFDQGGILTILAELTLAIVLFVDASRISIRDFGMDHRIPLRMLLIGMPLTIAAGALAAVLFFPELPLWSCVVLAVMLAPTDAALGQAVITRDEVPVRIRQSLNVESGLNDGLALPFFLVALSLASNQNADVATWLLYVGKQLVLGPLCGAAVGLLGGRIAGAMADREWMDEDYQRLSVLALALLGFASAEAVGGNGFIGAFVAGLTLAEKSRAAYRRLYEFGEAEGQLMTLLVFMMFGAVSLPHVLTEITVVKAGYILLSLTLLRMLPVAISLVGCRLTPPTLLFLGWFGPRGIATLLYGLVLLEQRNIPGREFVWGIACLAVLVSIFAHGLSAYPLARAYGRYTANIHAQAEEHMPMHEHPLRITHGKKRTPKSESASS